MQSLDGLFADYAAYHRTKGNKLFHRLGIPLIMLSLFGMLARVQIVRSSVTHDFIPGGHAWAIDAAMLLIAVATLYYFILDWRVAALMLVVSVVFYAIGRALPFALNAALFVLGWIFQFVGHSVYEHRQPAFLRNFVHLLIGPVWILNDVIPLVSPAGVASESDPTDPRR
jgi:uncharacterized membrane protein YGL010W